MRDNIASFGGDPDRITIAGESAGGHNVVALLASPLAAGLFHRALVQSGSFDSISVAEAEGTAGDSANPSRQISQALGAVTSEELRGVSLTDLFATLTYESGFVGVPRMIEDGVVLPTEPLRAATGCPMPIATQARSRRPGSSSRTHQE